MVIVIIICVLLSSEFSNISYYSNAASQMMVAAWSSITRAYSPLLVFIDPLTRTFFFFLLFSALLKTQYNPCNYDPCSPSSQSIGLLIYSFFYSFFFFVTEVWFSVMLSLFCIVISSINGECVYTLFVKTGSIIKGGTDSNISVTLSDAMNRSVWVPNLRSWGVMGAGHNYFERANLDAFSGRGPCIDSPVCRLNLTSDGSGSHHGWYCDSLEVTSTGPHKPCSQTIFFVDQWLAKDVEPHSLTAILDGCRRGPVTPHRRSFIVGNPKITSPSASASAF
ncbi:PLAT domain-containing protein 2-like [Gastrolobium bilobum]|uniref:PLAT domain-containing protein 2-like n=1 Tax=Gastrolobium bilobum TaxID=150636 RepID=UPI002AB21CB4|nr:PLAT domain-containing protein 2-like [Gastrolobium bilobum]